MILLKPSTCCLNVGSVKWIDSPLELWLLNEIFVYQWNFYVFTWEVVLINKLIWVLHMIKLLSIQDRVSGWEQSFVCPPPFPYSALLITWVCEVMSHSALQLQCERTSKPFLNFLPWHCPFIWPFVPSLLLGWIFLCSQWGESTLHKLV